MSGNVQQIVYDIMECDFEDELIISHLLDDCQVIEKFSDAWFKNAEGEREGKPRKGYMGHLYNMLKLIIHLADLHLDEHPQDDQHPPHLVARNKVRIKATDFRRKLFLSKNLMSEIFFVDKIISADECNERVFKFWYRIFSSKICFVEK